MAIPLRGYQHRYKDDLLAAFETHRAVLGVSPTGSGKTVVLSDLVAGFNGASSVIAHRKEIVSQISLSLAAFDVRHRIIAPRDDLIRVRRLHLETYGRSLVCDNARAAVASVQTLTSRAARSDRALASFINQVRFAVFDEAHHYVKQGHWGRALDMFSQSRILGVTATPERADGKGLGIHADGFAEVMVEGPTTKWLMENGYLARVVYKAPESDYDVSNIPLTASGDVDVKVLRARVESSHIVGDCVEHYQNYTPGKRAIVFVPDVKTAHETAESFNRAGVKAVALDGYTDAGVRDNAMAAFKRGETKVLVNVNLFDEGLDVPAVEAVFLMRFTKSLGKYLQMCGRVLRLFEGKEFGFIIDMVRNWQEHGPFNIARQWTLDRRSSGSASSASDTIPQRVCLKCTQPYEAFHPVCPYCGCAFVPPDRKSIKSVDGALVDLDLDALNEIMNHVKQANLAGHAFELDMVRRGIPAVGKNAERKRHRAAMYRRKVLRELVGYWMQAHPPGRGLAERQKRFYHFFGVDIESAGALNAKDTDALCNRIADRFVESITR